MQKRGISQILLIPIIIAISLVSFLLIWNYTNSLNESNINNYQTTSSTFLNDLLESVGINLPNEKNNEDSNILDEENSASEQDNQNTEQCVSGWFCIDENRRALRDDICRTIFEENCEANEKCSNGVCQNQELKDEANVCGNGLIDRGESCDLLNLNEKSCRDFNFDSGWLSCYNQNDANRNLNCQFDVRNCFSCTEINGVCTISCESESGLIDPDCETTEIICGNGIQEPGEECDRGIYNSDTEEASEYTSTCRTTCKLPRCGDNIVDYALGEQCDSGSRNSDTQEPNNFGDPCRTTCKYPSCGDGIVDRYYGEQCDSESYVGLCSSYTDYDHGELKCYPPENEQACKYDASECRDEPVDGHLTISSCPFIYGPEDYWYLNDTRITIAGANCQDFHYGIFISGNNNYITCTQGVHSSDRDASEIDYNGPIGLKIIGNNVTVKDCYFSNLQNGLVIQDSSNIILEDIRAQENGAGLTVHRVENFTILNSLFKNNQGGGLGVAFSKNGLIKNSIIEGNGKFYFAHLRGRYDKDLRELIIGNYGFPIDESENIIVEGNNVTDNIIGLSCWNCNNASISNNYFKENSFINLDLKYSQNNQVYKNKMLAKAITYHNLIIDTGSENNLIYSNNFTNPKFGRSIPINAFNFGSNSWNSSQYGNYWFDFQENIGYPSSYHTDGSPSGIDYKPNR